MNRYISRLSFLAFVLTTALAAIAAPQVQEYVPQVKNGWEILFDGKNTDAWDVGVAVSRRFLLATFVAICQSSKDWAPRPPIRTRFY